MQYRERKPAIFEWQNKIQYKIKLMHMFEKVLVILKVCRMNKLVVSYFCVQFYYNEDKK